MKEIAIKDRKSAFYKVKDEQRQPLAVKDIDTGNRTVSIVGNTYNFLDHDGDVLLPGCSKKSIKERGVNGSYPCMIKHALFHDLEKLPGKMISLSEGEYQYKGKTYQGILADSKLSNNTLGNDTLISYKDGIYDNHSIGFRYMDYEFVERDSKNWNKYVDNLINPEETEGRNYIVAVKEISLFEISAVSFGANYMTPTLDVKSDQDALKLYLDKKLDSMLEFCRKIDRAVKEGQQSDETIALFEIKLAQVKQLVYDLTKQKEEFEPKPKDVGLFELLTAK